MKDAKCKDDAPSQGAEARSPTSSFVLRPSSFIANPSARRRGVIAFTALIMLSVLVVVTLSAMEEMGLEAKAAQNRNAVRQAYLCAYTGIDYCLHLSGAYSNWRALLGSGDWIQDYAVGGGRVTVSADDPDDGAVAGDPIGVVRFTAAATKGLAKRTVTALAQPPPGEAVRYVLCSLSTKDLQLKNGVRVYGDVRTSGKVTAHADVSLAGNIYTAPGQPVDGTLVDGDTQVIRTEVAVDAPPVDFSWYRSVAQELLLPHEGPNYVIANARLSPTDNPFGLTHPQGLYSFDAGGSEVRLRNSYVIGSLIITNASKVKIQGGYCHETCLKTYPALLCDSEIVIEIAQNLQESLAGADFNGDGDTTDVLVSQIRGVIYSSKKVEGPQSGDDPGPFYVSGAIVAHELVISGPGFHVSYDTDLAKTAVAGFQGPGLVPVRGSMQE